MTETITPPKIADADLLLVQKHLVEQSALGEVLFGRPIPTAELVLDGHQPDFREIVRIFGNHRFVMNAVEVLCQDFLALC